MSLLRRLKPQFSLRMLLLAFTAFAIGFPIWYRWPYKERWEERNPATGHLISTRISTWQRQWGGERLLHGPELRKLGKTTEIEATYRQGNLHGPYRETYGGKHGESGQYVSGKREGTWISNSGSKEYKWNWRDGLPDGRCEMRTPKGETSILLFDKGKLVSIDGREIDDAAGNVLDSRKFDDQSQTALELTRTTEIDFVEMPLKDVFVYMQERHNIPFVLDQRRIPDIDLPITMACRGLDLRSTLILMLAPHGLACDYRYGCLWITTADDARIWHDSTGVLELKPPVDSALARAWKEPVAVDAINKAIPQRNMRFLKPNDDVLKVPLAGVLDELAQRFAIDVDTTRLGPTSERPEHIKIVHAIRGLAFRDVLGQLLYLTDCRCQLDGETLVILPPEEKAK